MEYRPLSGYREVFDHSDETLFIQRTEDVEPVMDDLREEAHLNPGGWNKSRSMKHLGSIPCIIIDQWMQENPPFNVFAPGNEKEVVRRLKSMPKFLLSHY